MTAKEFAHQLSILGSETGRKYELGFAQIADRLNTADIDGLRQLLGDPKAADDLRYASFFCLATRYRRDRNLGNLTKLHSDFSASFNRDDHPTLDHLQAIHLLALSGASNLNQALWFASRARTRLPAHPGVAHAFADVVVTLLDNDRAVEQSTVDAAFEAVREAIAQERYPKFLVTEARLLGYRGRYDEAAEAIRTAISEEDSNEHDYNLRVNEYMTHAMSLRLHQAKREMRDQVDALKAEVRDVNVGNLQYLAMFTGLLSLVAASIGIAGRVSTAGALLLLPRLGLVLTLAFAALFAIIQLSHRPGRQWIWYLLAVVAAILMLAILSYFG